MAQLHFVTLYHFVKWCGWLKDEQIILRVYVLLAHVVVCRLEACVSVAAGTLPALSHIDLYQLQFLTPLFTYSTVAPLHCVQALTCVDGYLNLQSQRGFLERNASNDVFKNAS